MFLTRLILEIWGYYTNLHKTLQFGFHSHFFQNVLKSEWFVTAGLRKKIKMYYMQC